MKTIRGLNDLEQFGIIPLTGEADGLGFRILCDVTAAGAAVFHEAFGLPPDCPLSDNWNSGHGGPKHVGSVMLSRDAVPTLAIIAALKSGDYPQVLLMENGQVILMNKDEKWIQGEYHYNETKSSVDHICVVCDKLPQYQQDGCEPTDWPTCYGTVQRVFNGRNAHPHVGYRNTHAMSGRTE